MFPALPDSAIQLLDWSWDRISPYYRDLETRSLDSDGVCAWLSDWTKISDLVAEVYRRLYVATTLDTGDAGAEERYHAFLDQVFSAFQDGEQRLKERLLSSGLSPEGFELPLRKMRTEAEIFREENQPLMAEERKLASRYNKIIGAQTVQWQRQELTISQLRPMYQDRDRQTREDAWRLAARRQLEDRSAVGELWKELLALRLRVAANAGFGDYRAFRWRQLLRLDYTPDDCVEFHRAIEEVVVPAAARLHARRRQRLGLETLRPWDLDVDVTDSSRLAPFSDVSELSAGCSRVVRRVSPVLGGYFETMARDGLLELGNRKNKAPGGYCTNFPAQKRPFIFMNAVGLHGDVKTLLHECGHAFHVFEAGGLPYYQQRMVEMEFAEVASMAMEYLTSPYLALEEGGFYSRRDAARARIEHLEQSILFWPYMAVVDAFQQWVYDNPGAAADPDACDSQWDGLWRRFMCGVDWSGLEEELVTGWQRKLHIHTAPLYYVEYGLAQLGAVQVWRRSLENHAGAVEDYRRALALGGTVSIPELYSAAGARFAFDPVTLGDAVNLMEGTILELEAIAGNS